MHLACRLPSSPSHEALRRFRRTLLAATATLLATTTAATAKDCGGAVACACGDRVVASTTLAGHLNSCRQDGLTLIAGVLDCAGHQITGPGDRTAFVGIRIDRGQGAEVRNCWVRNFGRGVYVDGGSDNRVERSVLFSNRVGVWLGDGATRTQIVDDEVRDNREQGIHVGAGTSDNLVARNRLVQNRTENVSLLETRGNVVADNVLDKSREAAIALKHAVDNTFLRNVLVQRPIVLRGASSGNVFEDNQLASGRFSFKADEDAVKGWTYPHGNSVAGGSITKGGTCFDFVGAYDNEASGVHVDGCRPAQEREAGGLMPHGNVVGVIRDR